MHPSINSLNVKAFNPRPIHCYRLFGLRVYSELSLPELCQDNDFKTADITLEIAHIDEAVDDWRRLGAYCRVKGNRLWLKVPGVAVFWVSVDRIVVTPLAGSDEKSIHLYLLGNAMGALLHLRGFLVLHGNVLVSGGRAFAICGRSGVGKSTLTAALIKKGCQLVADELCVVNADGQLVSGYPEIKLWQDALETLEIDVSTLMAIRPHVCKYAWRDVSFQPAVDKPLMSVFCLRRQWQQWPHSSPLKSVKIYTGAEKFQQLRTQVYRPAYVDGFNLNGQSFRLLTTVLQRASVIGILRYKEKLTLGCLDELADLVMGHICDTEDGEGVYYAGVQSN